MKEFKSELYLAKREVVNWKFLEKIIIQKTKLQHMVRVFKYTVKSNVQNWISKNKGTEAIFEEITNSFLKLMKHIDPEIQENQ